MTQEKPKLKASDMRLVETVDEQVGLRVGATIDQFQIEELIGRGGVSEVYRATDTRTATTVALKFLLPSRLSDQQSCMRLRTEAKSITGLKHKNIVSVIEIRESETTGPYIVMEILEGKPLGEEVPLKQWRALEVCAQIADALAYSHSCGMIHRDIKPSNVMLLKDGGVKLVDFGLAKVFEPENPKHIPLTRTTELVGTPLYMSPEQCFGQDVDGRSDVYQLGCLLYQCLTGLPPFEGNNSFEAMFKHVSQEANFGNLPEPIVAILKTAMNKNPEERFQDMSSMSIALRDAIVGKSHLKLKKADRGNKTNSKLLACTGVCVLVLIAIGIVGVILNTHGSKQLTPKQLIAQSFYQEGVEHKLRGWTEQSRGALQKAIKLDEGEIGFKALSFLRSHLPAHPITQDAEQLNIQGYNLAHRHHRYADSEAVWLLCIQRYPNFEWPYSNLGSQYLDQGKPEAALPLLEKAVQINPFYTNALRNLAYTHKALGHKDKAIHFMQEAVDSDPTALDVKEDLEKLKAE